MPFKRAELVKCPLAIEKCQQVDLEKRVDYQHQTRDAAIETARFSITPQRWVR